MAINMKKIRWLLLESGVSYKRIQDDAKLGPGQITKFKKEPDRIKNMTIKTAENLQNLAEKVEKERGI